MKQVMQEARANINMPMIYMCIEYLNENILNLIHNPPKLRDVTESFISAPSIPAQKKKTSKHQTQRKRKLTEKELTDLSQKLVEKLNKMNLAEQYQAIGKVRNNLPAYTFKEQVVNAVLKNQVVIVCGETGCGKTTQVPQFILDHEIKSKQGSKCNIICTQPRRISAIGVAGRPLFKVKHVIYAVTDKVFLKYRSCCNRALRYCRKFCWIFNKRRDKVFFKYEPTILYHWCSLT
jgi:ATP-dependent RNA helicase DHX57